MSEKLKMHQKQTGGVFTISRSQQQLCELQIGPATLGVYRAAAGLYTSWISRGDDGRAERKREGKELEMVGHFLFSSHKFTMFGTDLFIYSL